MWPPVKKPRLRDLALISLVPQLAPPFFVRAEGDGSIISSSRDASSASSSSTIIEPTCESRTVNYITDVLPQQCLTISPAAISEPVAATTATTNVEIPAQTTTADAEYEEADLEDEEDLSTGAFMSFEEWKAVMLAKSGPDALEAKQQRMKDRRADGELGEGFDSLGDEGEISFDFDAYSDKITEMARPREREQEPKEQVEKVTYDEGFTYYRSKDAGTTCKERFSYSSFDAGATVKKTSSGAKNPTAILVENKDSYMLLECGMKNKFFIVELSDVILVDTVVIANFEFFSSMVRQFRVSISDRYPVKLDKWKVLGTFEARNSRDIQPFLVENPQDWARYLRVEILSHYGNEYYCPVSLLRVHGLRMLDSWKQVDPADLEGEEDIPAISEPVEEHIEVVEEPTVEPEAVEAVLTDGHIIKMEQSCWVPYWDRSYFDYGFCPINCTLAPGADGEDLDSLAQKTAQEGVSTDSGEQSASVASGPSSTVLASRQTAEPSPDASKSGSSVVDSGDRFASSSVSVPTPSSVSGSKDSTSVPSASQTVNENATVQGTSKSKPSVSPPVKSSSSKIASKPSMGSQTMARNKTSATTSAAIPTPTVQDSFFKALTKRLQILESNSTLSLQYIESQSRFLQEALAKLERRQVAKVDLFLDKLNNTVLSELREVRTLYDHIWQSTVIALESQREQTEHEIVALSTRVGVLADEVAFQKRMAIVQSVLLLGCLVLVIFSRGYVGAGLEGYYPSQFLTSTSASSSRPAFPTIPSTPRAQPKSRPSISVPGDISSGNTSPATARPRRDSARFRTSSRRSSYQHNLNRISPKDPDTLRPPSPRSRSDPSTVSTFTFGQPPTPSSLDMAYDSEPPTTMTPNGDYFSAATSVKDESSSMDERETETEDDMPPSGGRLYPDMLARQSERQLTPGSSSDLADTGEFLIPRSGRHSGATRKPLPALPEDPD